MSVEALGSVAPTDLVQARVALHNAVQLIASAGHNLAKPIAGDAHRSLRWEPELRSFRGVDLEGDFFVRVFAVDLVAELVKSDGTSLFQLELVDSPLIESLVILESQMPVEEKRRAFTFSVFDAQVPDPAVVDEALIAAPLAIREELAHYFGNAHDTLVALAADVKGASDVLAWPHHFDIATLLPGAKKDQVIGVGMSPGDAAIGEPYWYVTPPDVAPDASKTKLPAPWAWNTEGWTGMVLPASKLIASAKGKSMETKLRSTLLDCIEIGRKSSL